MTKMITWERAFVRMGFLFEKVDNSLLFIQENRQNVRLLERMLRHLGLEEHYRPLLFTPPALEVEEERFIAAFDESRWSREDFPGEVRAVILHGLDPYIAGIVRWCTAIGIRTAMSCDGHGKRYPSLYFNRGEHDYAAILDTCLTLLSHGTWQFRHAYGERSGHLLLRNRARERSTAQELREKTLQRDWLLDVAEALYQHQDELRGLVQQMVGVLHTTHTTMGEDRDEQAGI